MPEPSKRALGFYIVFINYTFLILAWNGLSSILDLDQFRLVPVPAIIWSQQCGSWVYIFDKHSLFHPIGTGYRTGTWKNWRNQISIEESGSVINIFGSRTLGLTHRNEQNKYGTGIILQCCRSVFLIYGSGSGSSPFCNIRIRIQAILWHKK